MNAVKQQYMSDEARIRQTLALGKRHRVWGWDCPALDIDFLAIEYDQGEPVALVEYKMPGALMKPSHPSIRAARSLADRASVPFFVVRYDPVDWSWWMVNPLNEKAREYIPERRLMSEVDYVGMLYHLRGKDIPQDLGKKLTSSMRPVAA